MRDDGADTSIKVTIAYDRTFWRSAMTGWWQSVVPPEPFVKRAIFWAVVWLGIGVLTMALYALGIGPDFVFAGLIGAAFLIGVFGYLQRTRMERFWDEVGRHWDKAGETQAVFGPEGLTLTDDVSRREMNWVAVDAVAGRKGLTVIRSGISMIVVPDRELPDGMTGKDFRGSIEAWRTT